MIIQLIDDEIYILEAMERVVAHLGHIPLKANTGDLAVELYKANKPDLVLLDIVMPGKNGVDVFKEIKRFDADANIYFVTACREEYAEAHELNPKGFLLKPIALDTMVRLIEANDKKAPEAD